MSALKRLKLLSVGIACLGAAQVAVADGDPRPTIQREAAMQRYKGCKYTDEMGKYLYECVKKNDGFGTHWCFDESLEMFCPKPTAQNGVKTTPAAAEQSKQ